MRAPTAKHAPPTPTHPTPSPPCSGVQSQCLYDAAGTIFCPTSFMNPVNYGSTFNDSLAFDLGAIIGVEARALWLGGATEYNGSPPPKIGLDAWSPNINVARDPRWGRTQEVPSEDPLINGRFGVGYTVGLQNGTDPRYLQAVVTLKHWDAYSLEDADGFTRYNFNAVVSPYALASTYWPAFKASVQQGGALGCVGVGVVEVAGVGCVLQQFWPASKASWTRSLPRGGAGFVEGVRVWAAPDRKSVV